MNSKAVISNSKRFPIHSPRLFFYPMIRLILFVYLSKSTAFVFYLSLVPKGIHFQRLVQKYFISLHPHASASLLNILEGNRVQSWQNCSYCNDRGNKATALNTLQLLAPQYHYNDAVTDLQRI